tara:strand:+ start:46 stop:1677 length:1632 start_codon:yes stop_codon:yes gene_type:complete
MAVVSISRIQVRRGQKNAGSGLPQLASGEFGWAVDTQELFIGNGSVSEGAPYVGNTKLLSENDNLFVFADTYSYKNSVNVQTGDSPNNPVLRTLQDRLDDRVSIRAFGAPGDGTNQTVALQRAVDQLYLNATNKGQSQARVELILEPGIYTVTNTIYLPPFTTIRGAGADKTIINAGNFVAFQTVNETSTPGVYASDAVSTTLNQARKISISGLTINSEHTALSLVSCKDSIFKDIILSGDYVLGGVGAIDGILMSSLSTVVSSNNNLFDNVVIKKFQYGVRSDNDIKDNIWTDCTFDTLQQGVAFGSNTILGTPGMKYGPINNTITNSVFNEIYESAITITTGTDNNSKNNKFYQCGNNSATGKYPYHAIIIFNDIDERAVRNLSMGDWFQRSQELGYNGTISLELDNIQYYPEVQGPTITDFETTHKLTIGQSSEYIKLFRLPAESARGYEIDYIYKSTNYDAMRTGTIILVVDSDRNTFTISDEYNYTGSNTYAENLKFTAENYKFGVDPELTVDTVAIMMLNLTSSDNATMYYKVTTKS